MRELSWNIFAATGNIDSYLLYKEQEQVEKGIDDEGHNWEEPTDAIG